MRLPHINMLKATILCIFCFSNQPFCFLPLTPPALPCQVGVRVERSYLFRCALSLFVHHSMVFWKHWHTQWISTPFVILYTTDISRIYWEFVQTKGGQYLQRPPCGLSRVSLCLHGFTVELEDHVVSKSLFLFQVRGISFKEWKHTMLLIRVSSLNIPLQCNPLENIAVGFGVFSLRKSDSGKPFPC